MQILHIVCFRGLIFSPGKEKTLVRSRLLLPEGASFIILLVQKGKHSSYFTQMVLHLSTCLTSMLIFSKCNLDFDEETPAHCLYLLSWEHLIQGLNRTLAYRISIIVNKQFDRFDSY